MKGPGPPHSRGTQLSQVLVSWEFWSIHRQVAVKATPCIDIDKLDIDSNIIDRYSISVYPSTSIIYTYVDV